MVTNTKPDFYRRRALLLGAMSSFILALFVSLLLFVNDVAVSTYVLIYASGVMAHVILLLIGKAWINSKNFASTVWLHPPLLINLWWVVAYLLPGLYVLSQRQIYNNLNAWVFVRPDNAVRGIFVFFLGMLVFWVVYGASLRSLPTFSFLGKLSVRPIGLRPVLLAYLVGLAFYLLNAMVAGVAYGSDVSRLGGAAMLLDYSQDIRLLALAIAALQTFRYQWPKMILIGMIAVEVLIGFSSGFMKPIFILGLILLLSAMSSEVKIFSAPIVFSAIITFVMLLIVVPVAENLRDQINAGYIDSNDMMEVIAATNQAVEDTWIQAPKESLTFTLDRFFRRQSFVAFTPGLIMQLTPSVFPYQGVSKIISAPLYVFPRIIWKDKPTLTQGRWFSVVYVGRPASTESSSAITFFGEGYIAKGVLGVIWVGVFMGLIMAFWYKNLALQGLTAVFITVLPGFIDIEGDFTSAFVYAIQAPIFFVLVYWGISWLSQKRQVRRFMR